MTDVRPINALASVPVGAIDGHPRNVRTRMRDLDELADSIREVGVLQPLTVERQHNGRYLILAGHRRLAAAKKAGLSHVPCILRRDQLPDEALVLMLVENTQRRNLDPIEEAHALNALMAMVGTQAEVARRIGKSVPAVNQRLMLLHLTPGEQEAVRRGDLQVGEARQVARQRNGTAQQTRFTGFHFGKTHPLAADVKARCQRAGHSNARRVGGQGCGHCWEAVIRADERASITGQGAIA